MDIHGDVNEIPFGYHVTLNHELNWAKSFLVRFSMFSNTHRTFFIMICVNLTFWTFWRFQMNFNEVLNKKKYFLNLFWALGSWLSELELTASHLSLVMGLMLNRYWTGSEKQLATVFTHIQSTRWRINCYLFATLTMVSFISPFFFRFFFLNSLPRRSLDFVSIQCNVPNRSSSSNALIYVWNKSDYIVAWT